MGKDKKVITTIHVSRNVLLDIKNSGISNVSKYFEDLARADLHSVDTLSGKEKDQLDHLKQQLAVWTKEWDQFIKKSSKRMTA